MKLTLGIDIGQVVDPTAIVLSEMQWRPAPQIGPGSPAYIDHHIVRFLNRLKLGTKYPEITRELIKLIAKVKELVPMVLNSRGKPEWPDLQIFVDATGVGRPVTDSLKEAGEPIIPCYFLHGEKRNELREEVSRALYVNLGKAFMVSKLQVIMQNGRLHLPDNPEARALARELADYEIKVDKKAVDTYGAFRTGAHDDLVTALGLSVQKSPSISGLPATGPGRVPMAMPSYAQKPQSIMQRMMQGRHSGVLSDGGNGLSTLGITEQELERRLRWGR